MNKNTNIDINQNTPQVVISQYYNRPFLLLHLELEREGIDAFSIHEKRKSFWQLVPNGHYNYIEANNILKQYLKSLEKELCFIIKKNSIAYWLHLYRRISPKAMGHNKNPMTIGLVRAALEAAFQKYGKLKQCDRVGFTHEIELKDILNGLLLSSEFDLERDIIQSRQMVLTNFGIEELKKLYTIEKIAYEIWRCMAILRAVGKGAILYVDDKLSELYGDARDDDLDFLIKNYDDRINRLQTCGVSAKGIAYSKLELKDSSEIIFIPYYNVGSLKANHLNEYTQTIFNKTIQPDNFEFNFIWLPFNIRSYYNSHKFLAEAFKKKNKISLLPVLSTVVSLCFRLNYIWKNEGLDQFVKFWQHAYEGPYLKESILKEIKGFLPAALKVLNISEKDKSKIDILQSFDYWKLNNSKQKMIDTSYPGPHSIFIPYNTERFFIDYTWIHRLLYDLFWSIQISDENFKADIFEEMVRYMSVILPVKGCKSSNGEKRQVDASYALGDQLIIIEYKANSKSIVFEKGDMKAINYRIKLIDKALEEIDDKAEWLVRNPVGTNYDIRYYKYIVLIVITPFIEYIPNINKKYWLTSTLPRVLTLDEFKETFTNESLKEVSFNRLSLS